VKISKIEPQKRNKNRSSIYVDDEYKFSLSNELVMKYDLRAGYEITDEEINELFVAKEKDYIKERAFRILRYRDRSSLELKQRLVKIGFDEPMVNEVINGFITDKTLDDSRLVQEFVSDYTKVNPKGNRFVVHELRKKGIPPEIIEEAVKARDEKSIAEEFISRKLADLDLKNPKGIQKAWQRLAARGFSPEVIRELLNKYRYSNDH